MNIHDLFNWGEKPAPDPLPEAKKPEPEKPKNPDLSAAVAPEPDLSTKPKNVVGYCFGFVCPKKHVGPTFESITTEGHNERKVCQTCGSVSKPAVVKRTSEARWGDRSHASVFDLSPKPNWGWFNSYDSYMGRCLSLGDLLWTKAELVYFLDDKKPRPRRRKK